MRNSSLSQTGSGREELLFYFLKKWRFINSVKEGDIAAVKALLESGINVTAKSRLGHNALSWSVQNSHPEIVKLLLTKGVDVNDKNKYGATVLMAASALGQFDIVETLLANDAMVNEKNVDGNTALKLAVKYKHIRIAKVGWGNEIGGAFYFSIS